MYLDTEQTTESEYHTHLNEPDHGCPRPDLLFVTAIESQLVHLARVVALGSQLRIRSLIS